MMFCISDEAWQGLVRQGRERNWIKPELERPRGLSRYIEALSLLQFMDTRPDDLAATDAYRASHNMPKLWFYSEERRWTHTLSIPPEVEHRLIAIAIAHEITNPRRGSSTDESFSQMSAVLEAIGLGHLTPTTTPTKLLPMRVHKHYKRKELAW